MSAYRFCRSDDVPLIVEAYRRCNVGPGAVPWRLTADHMKRLGREFNLWTSSCMVAFAGPDPIGVLIAAKRAPIASLVLHTAVHPDHRGQGHGHHVMASLSRKMAILEPTRMIVEAPIGNDSAAAAARSFLEACGYIHDTTLTDYTAPAAGTASAAPIAMPLTLADAESIGALDAIGDVCWQRQAQTIRNLRDRVQGLAIASDRQVEAFVLYRNDHDAGDPLPFFAPPAAPGANGDEEAACEILACGAASAERAGVLVGMLLSTVAAHTGRALHLARVDAAEPIAPWLKAWGFAAGASRDRYLADAAAA